MITSLVSSLLIFTVATFVSYRLNTLFIKAAPRLNLMDIPNFRSAHQVPTPRGAGIIFSVLSLLGLFLFCYEKLLPARWLNILIPSHLILALVSFVDDLKPLSFKIKLLVHVLVASVALFFLHEHYHVVFMSMNLNFTGHFSQTYPLEMLFQVMPTALTYLLLALTLIWSINVYNFMDGTDGQAGGQGVFIFSIAAVMAYLSQAYAFSLLLFLIAGLLLGFLILNKPIAKLFMGDSGSCFLGFFIPNLALLGFLEYKIPLSHWLIAYSPFWFDATFTTLRRILNGKSVVRPHRGFLFQILQKKHSKDQYAALKHLSTVNVFLLCVLCMPGLGNLERIGLSLLAIIMITFLKINA